MSSPYTITEPTLISFSGGRSSAYMLHQVLDVNGGLPDGSAVAFANTGKEMPETLDFVQACSNNWDVPITWLEFPHGVIRPEDASRNGEPFAAMIAKKKMLPNRVMRFCTSELKVKLINALGHDMQMIGIRADEGRRAAKIHNKQSSARVTICPMWEAGVTVDDVMAFWRKQPFDLQLPPGMSNCDLCFLKGMGLRKSIAEVRPESVTWWAEQEDKLGATFDNRLPAKDLLRAQVPMFEETVSCFCGD